MKCKFKEIWEQYEDEIDKGLFWVAGITSLAGILFFTFLCALICFAGDVTTMAVILDFFKENLSSLIFSLLGVLGSFVVAAFEVKKVVEKNLATTEDKILTNQRESLNPSTNVLHDEHTELKAQNVEIRNKVELESNKLFGGINQLVKKNEETAMNFTTLDRSTQNILNSISGFQQLVEQSVKTEHELRVQYDQLAQKYERLLKRCKQLEEEKIQPKDNYSQYWNDEQDWDLER